MGLGRPEKARLENQRLSKRIYSKDRKSYVLKLLLLHESITYICRIITYAGKYR